MNDEIAIRVAGDLPRAERLHLGVHRGARALRGADEIDLVALHDPPCDVARVVRLQVSAWGTAQCLAGARVQRRPTRSEIVVEEMGNVPGGGHPPYPLDLAGPRLAVGDVGLGLVIVVAGVCGPIRLDLRVERPVSARPRPTSPTARRGPARSSGTVGARRRARFPFLRRRSRLRLGRRCTRAPARH